MSMAPIIGWHRTIKTELALMTTPAGEHGIGWADDRLRHVERMLNSMCLCYRHFGLMDCVSKGMNKLFGRWILLS